MTPPLLQINNFIQPKSKIIKKNKKIQIDFLSKVYIVHGLILGINRMSLVNSSKTLFIMMTCYYVLTNAVLFYGCLCNITILLDCFAILDLSSFFIYTTLSGLAHTRLCKFYKELNKFDVAIGFKAKVSRASQYNIWAYFVTVGLNILLYFYYYFTIYEIKSALFLICAPSAIILQALELHYYGHLFTLVIPRLKIITWYFKIACPNPVQDRDDNAFSSQEFKAFIEHQQKYSYIGLKELTTFYDKIINIYDYLNSAIKWQILALLATTFIQILLITFMVMLFFIRGTAEAEISISDASFVCTCLVSLAIKIAHIMVPSVFANSVYKEACSLREILAGRLYENTLDKSDRGSARTLLALMETRDLSFSLFHMINVDISLPFKFLSLLLTYLVILLQFDKVMNS